MRRHNNIHKEVKAVYNILKATVKLYSKLFKLLICFKTSSYIYITIKYDDFLNLFFVV